MTTTTTRQKLAEYLTNTLVKCESNNKNYNLVEDIINIFVQEIESLYPQNPIDTQYKTGYYNAICNVLELLTKK